MSISYAQSDNCAGSPNLPLACGTTWDGTLAGVSATTISPGPSDCTIPAGATDIWGTFDPANTGTFVFEYSGNQDVILAIYDACGGILIDCKDEQAFGNSTESITINVTDASLDYKVQVIDKNGGTDLTGTFCVFNGVKADYDLCRDALEISVGDCDFNFEISSQAQNLEQGANYPSCNTPITDGWLYFKAGTVNERIGFSFYSESNDVAMVVYDAGMGTDPNCSNLSTVTSPFNTCVDDIMDVGEEYVEFDVTANHHYYIRIVNKDGGTVDGQACLYTVYARNACGVSNPVLPVNACNIPVNIDSDYHTDTGISNGGGCTDMSLRTYDVWVSYTAQNSGNLLVSYDADQTIQLAIYNSASGCPPPNDSQIICADYNDIFPETDVETTVSAGVTYYIRILSDNPTKGQLCVVEGTNVSQDAPCSSAGIDLATSCTPENFVLLKEYFQDPLVFKDLDSDGLTFVESEVSCIPALHDPITVTGLNTRQDAWVKLNLTAYSIGEEVTVIFDNNNNSPLEATSVSLEIFKSAVGCCPSNNCMERITSPLSTTCVDDVIEGSEVISFIPSAESDYATSEFYLRVANIENNTDIPTASTIFGKVCFFKQTLKDGDLCSNARTITINDCDTDFGWESGDYFNNTIGSPSCATSTGLEDGWMVFTANSDNTTFEFIELSGNMPADRKDVAVVIYKNNCGSLAELACTNTTTPGDLVELSFNTVSGNEYYIRVINLTDPTASASSLDGKYCLYNTVAQDVCDISALSNLYVGACNVRFNIPSTFELSGLENFSSGPRSSEPPNYSNTTLYPLCFSNAIPPGPGNSTMTGRDAWVRMIGSGGTATIQYENFETSTTATTGSDPAIIVYTHTFGNGPVDCGVGINGSGNINNEIVCANNIVGIQKQTESITFPTLSGQFYLIRIVDLANIQGNGNGMRGTLCISNGGQSDDCANAIEVDMTDCNVPLTVVNNAGSESYTMTGPSFNGVIAGVCTAAPTANYSDCSVADASPSTEHINVGGDLANFNVAASTSRFIKFEATSTSTSIDYYNYTNTATATLTLYNTGCGTNIATNTAGAPGEMVSISTFATTPGNFYIVEVSGGVNALNNGRLRVYNAESGPPADSWAKLNIDHTNYPDPDLPPGNWKYPSSDISVQYNNNNSSFSIGNENAVLEIYSVTNCADLSTYTLKNSCADEVTEGIELVNFDEPLIDGQSYEFYVRVISKSSESSLYGKLCSFFGETIGEDLCSDAEEYAPLDGEWQGFDVEQSWTSIQPSTQIPNCVYPTKTAPAMSNPPIKTQGWFKFHIPNGANITGTTAVTVQYNNDTDLDGDDDGITPQNAAMAIYAFPNHRNQSSSGPGASNGFPAGASCGDLYEEGTNATGADIGFPSNGTNANGMFLVDCINSVHEGTESLTIPVEDNTTYFVRIMNVSNTIADMPGRVRVFPFTDCQEGPEMVLDGDFSNWKEIRTLDGSGTDNLATTAEWSDMDNWLHPNPKFKSFGNTSDAGDFYLASNDATGALQDIREWARFATEYGYLQDRSDDNDAGDHNKQRNLHRKRNEFSPEGQYTVAHTTWNYKDNWFCYGNGYTGYGGGMSWNHSPNYCKDGNAPGWGSEACGEYDDATGAFTPTYGNYTSGTDGNYPAQIPHFAEANFMTLNGWFKKPSNFPNQIAGKMWCQTMDLGPSTDPRYYVFTAWFQNVKSINQSGDVPQLRITICDMENPDNLNQPTADLPAGNLTPVTGNTSVLPGTTYTTGTMTTHLPGLPNNTQVQKSGAVAIPYGAAMHCNLPTEGVNKRLKVLGSDFYLPQEPDQWVVIRCIYRAPVGVNELNLCIENLSLSKNGNDFATDDISFRECISPDTDRMDALLKGDACELADSPEALGIPLKFELLDFTGKDIGQKVALNWLTLIEQNVAFYEVQRSLDGRNFAPIGRVEGKGQINTLLNYDFLDEDLPKEVSTLYYRLLIHNGEAEGKYTRVVKINLQNPDRDLLLYPNPIQSGDDFTLQFFAENAQQNLVIEARDLLGNPMFNYELEPRKGLNEYVISSQGLKPGIYIIKAQQGDIQKTAKLVVL